MLRLKQQRQLKLNLAKKYEFLDEKEGWYKIKFNGDKEGLVSGEFEEGWVFSQYATKEE